MTRKLHAGNGRGGGRRGPLARLLADTGGTTFAVVGAALVPMAAMVGSGIDLSRGYMAQSRLQTACDAAALAGRRAMSGDTLTTAATDEARKFFNFNFEQGKYQTDAFTPAITRPSTGTVRVEASTRMKTSIMHMFGIRTLPISTSCEATQNYVNTDVVLVLDVTGSMGDAVGGTAKIVALREAVMAFYDELAPIQAQLQAAGMRLRYSVVPYSSTVNVGRLLRARDPGFISNLHTYQSRIPIYFTSTQESFKNQTEAECNARRQARTPGGDVFPATEKTVSWPGKGDRRDCVVTTINWNTTATGQFARRYLHVAVPLNTATYKTGASTPVPSRAPGTTLNSTWNGCIEERETVSTINASSGYSIPDGAFDLNVNLIPNNDATRWKPMWPDVSYLRYNENDDQVSADDDGDDNSTPETDELKVQGGTAACPAEAVRLQAFTRAQMQAYVDALTPVGGTYHDTGMIWGARMISSAGVFGDSPDNFNGMPTSRHVIFMTDGQLAPQRYIYGMYGIEAYDQRITGQYDAADQYNRHEHRFRMMCNATKGLSASLWVIAFDAAATPALNDCATNSSQVAVISDKAALIAKFKEIGKNVGALRLHQ